MKNVIESLEARTLLADAVLLKDINVSSQGTNPSAVVEYNNAAYFVASSQSSPGAELYKTDGTSAGTTLVRVVSSLSATATASTERTPIVVVGGLMYFCMAEGVGAETRTYLWKSDGTQAGTQIVGGSVRALQTRIIAFNGELYFASDSTSETDFRGHLYHTDGTTITRIEGFDTGNNNSNFWMAPLGGWLYFTGDDGAHGYEICRTNGTTTELVTDAAAGASTGFPTWPTAYNNELYFTYFKPESGVELWKTDGVLGHESIVIDIGPGTSNALISSLQAVAGKLYFSASDGINGNEPLVSDGTAAGTVMLADIRPGSGSSNPGGWIAYDGRVFFQSEPSSGVFQTYTTQGTAATTASFGATLFTPGVIFDGMLYASGRSGSARGIYRTDGTTTSLFWQSTQAGNMSVVGDQMFFSADDGLSGVELYVTDGTVAGTGMVKDLSVRTEGSEPRNITALNGTLIFTASMGPSNRQGLYKSDGTAAGTTLLADLTVGLAMEAKAFVRLGELVIFSMRSTEGSHPYSLWKTDGTTAGTVRLSPINFNIISDLNVVADHLLFNGSITATGDELWKTDGTAAGTAIVADLNKGPGGSSRTHYQVVGDTMYFDLKPTDADVAALWKTDGTLAGTMLVSEIDIISPAQGTDRYFVSADLNGKLILLTYVRDTPTTTQYGLWVSDGTDAGTELITSLPNFSPTQIPLVVNGFFYFNAGNQLWRSDGTAAGTTHVTETSLAMVNPKNLVLAGSRILFNAGNPGTVGYYDTADGTSGQLWAPNTPGLPNVMRSPVSRGNRVFFSGDASGASFLWQTDGTAASTFKVPGLTFPYPANYTFPQTVANGTLYFQYTDGLTGLEPWMIGAENRPAIPTGFNASRVKGQPGRVVLTWTSADDVNGYLLQRSSSATFASIDMSAHPLALQTEFIDNTAGLGSVYY